MTRENIRAFVETELKLCACLRVRAEQHKRDKCGVSWLLLKDKCNKWGEKLGHTTYEASDG